MTGALHEISPFFQKLFLLFLSAFPIRTSAAPCVRAILPVTTYIFNDDNLKKNTGADASPCSLATYYKTIAWCLQGFRGFAQACTTLCHHESFLNVGWTCTMSAAREIIVRQNQLLAFPCDLEAKRIGLSRHSHSRL